MAVTREEFDKMTVQQQKFIKDNQIEITEEVKKTTEEMEKQAEATKRIKLNTSEALKFSRELSAQEDKRVKLTKDLESSLLSSLGALIKGNYQEILTYNQKKDTLRISEQLRVSGNDTLRIIKDEGKLQGLSADARKQIFDLTKGINDGLYGEIDALATIENLNKSDQAILNKKGKTGEDFTSILQGHAKLGDKEQTGRNKLLLSQNKINATLAKGGMIFTALAAIAKQFNDVVKAIGEDFGALTTLSGKFKSDLFASSIEAQRVGKSIKEVNQAVITLSSEFGINKDLAAGLAGQVIDTAVAVGLTTDEAAKLTGTLISIVGLTAEQAENFIESTKQAADLAGVVPADVLKDMASSANDFALSTKGGAQNLRDAAIAARTLGISLQTTEKISDSLLDIQSSLKAEQTASVLLGKELNFNQARLFALEDNRVGLLREITNQLGSQTKALMSNRLIRKEVAKSIGVEADELLKMINNQNRLNDATKTFGQTFRDLLGSEALDQITKITTKFLAFAAQFIRVVGPILNLIMNVVDLIITKPLSFVGNLMDAVGGAFGGTGIGSRGGIVAGGGGGSGAPIMSGLNSRGFYQTPLPFPSAAPQAISSPRTFGTGGNMTATAVIRGKDIHMTVNNRPLTGGDAGYSTFAK